MKQENSNQSAIALSNGETMLKQLFGSSPDEDLISPEGEEDGAPPLVLKCADGDLCRFGTST
eukprot:14267024-Ditylum_brightwellii.AAC.1